MNDRANRIQRRRVSASCRTTRSMRHARLFSMPERDPCATSRNKRAGQALLLKAQRKSRISWTRPAAMQFRRGIRKNSMSGTFRRRLETHMKIAQNTSSTIASAPRQSDARSFAHHYGGIGPVASPERTLRVYPPLGWGVGQVMPHVRRAARFSESRHDGAHATRVPLAL